MKQLYVYYMFIIVCVSLTACTDYGIKKMNKKIEYTWVVEEMRYKGKDILWDEIDNIGNLMVFKKDSVFKPILRKGQPLEPFGHWYIFKKRGEYFVLVSGCADSFFNRIYSIKITPYKGGYIEMNTLELSSGELYIRAK